MAYLTRLPLLGSGRALADNVQRSRADRSGAPAIRRKVLPFPENTDVLAAATAPASGLAMRDAEAEPIWKRWRRSTDGTVAIIFALASSAVLVGAAIAIDYARLIKTDSELQTVADAAALAGARTLVENWSMTDAEKIAAAEAAALAFSDQKHPDADESIVVNLDERTVTVALVTPEKVAFGGTLGKQHADVRVLSVATVAAAYPACVIALDESATVGFKMGGNASAEAKLCSIWSNSRSATSMEFAASTTAKAKRICAVGGAMVSGSIDPRPETNCAAVPDPFKDRDFSSISTSCDYTNVTVEGKKATLSPGVYCGRLTIKADADLMPGVYVIRDGVLRVEGAPTIKAPGVSILLSGVSSLRFEGKAKITLSATTSGPLAGLAIAADPTSTGEARIAGDVTAVTSLQASLTGSIYLPGRKLLMTGSSEVTQSGSRDKLVAGQIELSGTTKFKNMADENADINSAVVRLVK